MNAPAVSSRQLHAIPKQTQAASPGAAGAPVATVLITDSRGATPTAAAVSPPSLKKKIVIFEVAGGTDKGPDGHRKDTMPLVAALERRGWAAEVLFYTDAARQVLFDRTLATADGFMMRVNPGPKYDDFTDEAFMAMGRELHAKGCHALQHPDVMLWDCKDSLVKLTETASGLPDTFVYYTLEHLKREFPVNIAQVCAGSTLGGWWAGGRAGGPSIADGFAVQQRRGGR